LFGPPTVPRFLGDGHAPHPNSEFDRAQLAAPELTAEMLALDDKLS
jgi:hypothetical protein